MLRSLLTDQRPPDTSSFPTRRPNVKVTYTSRRAASAATDRQTPHTSQKSDADARSQQPVRRQEQENMGAININVNAGSNSEAVKGGEMKQKEPKEECERTLAKKRAKTHGGRPLTIMHFFQPAANESGKKATTSASTAGGKGAAPKFVESAASAQASQGSATVPTKRSLEQSLSSPTLTSTSPRPHWHTPSSKKPPLLSSTSPPTTLPPSTTPPTTYAQLHLDLGQKSLTACPTCNMSYARSRPDDVATHARYHAAAVEGVMWGPASSSSSASAGERVVREFADGAKVVCVEREGCGVKVWKKALSVVILVNTELGAAAPAEVDEGSKIFLYITPSRRVAGCVLVERITTAYRVVVSDTATDIQPENNDPPREELVKNGSVAFRSTCPVPASCGISRIWVLKSERRKGVAGRMLDVVRTRFVFGYTLSPTDDMAFSQPTMAGKALAERMCGGRKDFLVY